VAAAQLKRRCLPSARNRPPTPPSARDASQARHHDDRRARSGRQRHGQEPPRRLRGGNVDTSPHQSRNELRNPCTVTPWAFVRRRTISIVMLLSGLPRRWPGKTYSPVLAAASASKMAVARFDNATRCSRPLFMRTAGTVQSFRAKFISVHFAPSVSDVLAAVRIVNSSASAATDSRSRNWARKAGTSAKGMAAWWPRVNFWRFGRSLSKWPRQRAGLASCCPIRPRARAASSTVSIRPRSRDAVSGMLVHSGCSTSSTAAVSISLTGRARNGPAYFSRGHVPLGAMLAIAPFGCLGS
jgi:hypothetical protein